MEERSQVDGVPDGGRQRRLNIYGENVGLSRVRLLPPNEINAKQSTPKRGRRSCMKLDARSVPIYQSPDDELVQRTPYSDLPVVVEA